MAKTKTKKVSVKSKKPVVKINKKDNGLSSTKTKKTKKTVNPPIDNKKAVEVPEEPKKRKKRITKEELEELLKLRKKTIKSKEKHFKSISEAAHAEWLASAPCEKCRFLNKDCHKTCGVAMKFMHTAGKVDRVASFGSHSRIVSEDEYNDVSSVNLGLMDEVDKVISDEINGSLLSESNEISLSELDSSLLEIQED